MICIATDVRLFVAEKYYDWLKFPLLLLVIVCVTVIEEEVRGTVYLCMYMFITISWSSSNGCGHDL